MKIDGIYPNINPSRIVSKKKVDTDKQDEQKIDNRDSFERSNGAYIPKRSGNPYEAYALAQALYASLYQQPLVVSSQKTGSEKLKEEDSPSYKVVDIIESEPSNNNDTQQYNQQDASQQESPYDGDSDSEFENCEN